MFLLLLLPLAVLGACGDGDDEAAPGTSSAPAATSFAGPIQGSNLVLAVVTGPASATAYLSDDDRVAEWMKGELREGSMTLTSSGGARLEGSRTASSVSGSLTHEGKTYQFSLPAVSGEAGLYRYEGEYEGEQALAGWIVLPDGREAATIKTTKGVREAPGRGTLFARPVISPS